MFSLRYVAVALAIAASLARPARAATFYASTMGELWRIDVPTGAGTLIGNTGFAQVTDLAASPTGELYGTTGTELILIDPGTAAATSIGSHGPLPGLMVGLDFAADGTLYGVTQAAGGLIEIDAATGAAVSTIPLTVSAVGDVAVDGDCTLYGSFQPGQLVQLSAVLGELRTVGNTPLMSGLDFEPTTGRLIGFLAPNDQLGAIDTLTGAVDTTGFGAAPIRVFGATFLEPYGCTCDPSPSGPPSVGNNLRMIHLGDDLLLSWLASRDAIWYSVRRDDSKLAIGLTEQLQSHVTTAVDRGRLWALPALSFYQVRLVDCAGELGPI